ncbi:MAG: nuclear transport factor 2 family protein [Bacteroidota bacterium]
MSQAAQESKTIQLVRAMENRRFESMVKSDTVVLSDILADDLVYTHSNGQTDTKANFIYTISSKKTEYKSIQPESVQIREYGTTAVVNGQARVHVFMNGQELKLLLRYTDVYVKRKGRWQMVAWQSTRLPDQ